MPEDRDEIIIMRDIRDYPIMAKLEVEKAMEEMRASHLPGVVVNYLAATKPGFNPAESSPDYELAAKEQGVSLSYVNYAGAALPGRQGIYLIIASDKPELTQEEVDQVTGAWEKSRQGQ